MARNRLLTSFQVDIIQLVLLFMISVIAVYFTPYIINQLFFLVVLFLFWNSRKDYFWIAFLFVLYDQPSGFFSGGLRTDIQRLPIYTFAAGLSLSVHDFFYLVAILKAFMKGKKSKFILARPLAWLLVYFLFSYFISIALGMGYKTHVQTIRSLIPFTMFFFMPMLMRKKEDYSNLLHLLFPVMFLVIAGQFYQIIFGAPLAALLKKDAGIIAGHFIQHEGLMRAIDSPYLNIFCLIGASFFALQKASRLRRIYYYSIISICVLSMFLSATRGWIIAYAVMLLVYLFFIDKSLSNVFAKVMVLSVLTYLVIFSNPVITRQSERVVDRVMTMKKLVEGDVTAGGTLTRIDEHSPRVMKKFWESPIIGFGISDEAYKYADEHVGNQSMLLEMGIVGFAIFIFFIARFTHIVLQVENMISRRNSFKRTLLVFIMGLIGLFIIHSSSTQIFGYILHQEKIFLVSLYFLMAGVYIKSAIEEHRGELERLKINPIRG